MIHELQILNARILIVDDDPAVGRRLEGELRDCGHEMVRTTTDPAVVAEIYGDFRPDIVLLDVAMPGLDGFAVMDQLIELEKGSYLPVLLMIGPDEDEDSRLRALASPAKDILTKPIDFNEAYLRMCNLLEVRILYTQNAESKHKLESVLDFTGEAIAMFDPRGHLAFANRQFEETFGFDDGLAPGVSAKELRESIRDRFHESAEFVKTDEAFFEDTSATVEDVIELRWPSRRLLYRYTTPVVDEEKEVLGRLVAYRDVSKDVEIEQMKAEVIRLRAELEAEYGFDTIISRSRKMREVFDLMRSTLDNDITVLIQGESGTGKELVARAIHFNSPRRQGPFVTVNCAAIPDSLIESELFGHERGAFTGAVARRIGRFEQADGGSIFLDEIGEMDPLSQAKLLRVLQDRSIQRVGGTGTISVDVRVIVATHRDLQAAVASSEFREDLYYRVAVFPIQLPPLRDHREDIALLAEHFLLRYSESLNKTITGMSPAVLQQMMDYDSPGNVRQLENVIQRAVVLETSETLQAGSLPVELRSRRPAEAGLVSVDDDDVPPISLDESERLAILRALDATDHNVHRAARILGVNRTTLYRKLRKYELETSS